MNKKILIVEDSIPLLNALFIALKRVGYFVTKTADGEEGMKKSLSKYNNKPEFDLVITDLDIPGRSGFEIIESARVVEKKMKFLVITGYMDQSILDDLHKNGVYNYLYKPFSIEEFLSKVNQCLNNC